MTGGVSSFQPSFQAVMHPTLGMRRRAELSLSSTGAVVCATAGAAADRLSGAHLRVGSVLSGVVLPRRAFVRASGTGLRRREGQPAAS